jgi:predicted PurR-regulated permease PerM
VFNMIPYLGPVIVTGGTGLVGFLQFGTVGMALRSPASRCSSRVSKVTC